MVDDGWKFVKIDTEVFLIMNRLLLSLAYKHVVWHLWQKRHAHIMQSHDQNNLVTSNYSWEMMGTKKSRSQGSLMRRLCGRVRGSTHKFLMLSSGFPIAMIMDSDNRWYLSLMETPDQPYRQQLSLLSNNYGFIIDLVGKPWSLMLSNTYPATTPSAAGYGVTSAKYGMCTAKVFRLCRAGSCQNGSALF